ncbi:DNA polymerase III delta subunit-like protein [Acidimicrobium ferrooxidans DSM 10331]|uniref:DNA-directed DNA polymerase n=1 Tax=Acidimicrobium ferrooxidans (strain DSM 10331 / JCM 15462 / NBRC 103882 / ICP) TaxID=525909 RepID=C7LZS5_ACIFD|nr:DNA polymerase III delta subunit-like protein [Acidimicrobium ferrooxidans]ACU54233.1 DNA polymerase III delta subunit-like protein [Acidimicrobium ferrooxidans DSM 10331]
MASVRLVACDDEVEVQRVVERERGVAAEVEFLHAMVDAAAVHELATSFSQLPMFADRRRIVVTGLGALAAREAGELVKAASEAPGPNEVVFVVVGEPAKSVVAHVDNHVEDRRRLRSDRRRAAIEDAFREVGLSAEPAVVDQLAWALGEEVSRAGSIARSLVGVVGEGGRVDEEALGAVALEVGARPPWELTDAIEAGDLPRALEVLDAMLAAQMPTVLLLTLIERRVLELFAVAGTGARDGAGVNAALREAGLRPRPDFAARALGELAAAIGPERAGRLVRLVATAARDLRGDSVAPDETTLRLLVARAASLVPRRAQRRSAPGPRVAPGRGRR